MNPTRRDFLKTSLAASATAAALGTGVKAAAAEKSPAAASARPPRPLRS